MNISENPTVVADSVKSLRDLGEGFTIELLPNLIAMLAVCLLSVCGPMLSGEWICARLLKGKKLGSKI